jgi:outer membrane protein assembly factor BamB
VPHIPSPLIVGNELYLVSDNGIASCLDAASGALHWRQRLGGSFAASPVHADGRIYVQSEQGLCTVIAAGREYRQLGATDLSEPILASCAVVDGAMFVRTEGSLYRIE